MDYELYLFFEILESIQGIQYLREGISDGIPVRYYQGIRGNLVEIDMSDDYIAPITGAMHLIKLGLGQYIPMIFPKVAEEFGFKKEDLDNLN